MELSSEDSFCLNVMLAAGVQAVRIDSNGMRVFGLTEKGEASVHLHPNCRQDQYLKLVKQSLAEHALDSPEGYPVYLRRWTRMGQLRDDNLSKLLLTGEEEAVVAVVHAPGLTNEIARRAWWIMPTIENARRMLEKEDVARGEMGKVLADFLVEHLPFEEDDLAIMDTVRALLWFDLVDPAAEKKLWARGKQHGAYFIGFLEQRPHRLPNPLPARADYAAIHALLAPFISAGNPYAQQLDQLLSGPGQTFLATCEAAMQRPGTHEIVSALLNTYGKYLETIRTTEDKARSMEEIIGRAVTLIDDDAPAALTPLLSTLPQLKPDLIALLTLAGVDQWAAYTVLRRTTAVNALLRTKLEPVFEPIQAQMRVLRTMKTIDPASEL
ncbi:MAG: sulfur reduction protein DsrS [Burkholderiales bacterium]|nr:sulfur reduction protein DsrS [Burkholderiales bacterium]